MDTEVSELIEKEDERQRKTICLIPSENFCSKDVLDALGSSLTNKYAEGYPRKRYYQGNDVIDSVEELAIKRAKELFGAEHANVQPNSGSPANMAVYFSVLKPGDKILAMDLNHGGHLTHGCPVNFSGKLFDFIHYEVDKETGLIDMNEVERLAKWHKPKMIVSGFTAYPRKVDFQRFSEIAKEIGAYSFADISHIAGLIVGGEHDSPILNHDFVMTTTHKTLRGPRGAIILCKEEFAKQIDKAVFPGLQGGPHEHVIAAKAISFKEANSLEFKEYAKQIVLNAKALANSLISKGINLVSNGTDNHLILIDLIKTDFIGEQGLGKKYAQALDDAGIVTNANTVPFDPSTPFKPSGIRIGTPAVTTMGAKEEHMEILGELMYRVLKDPDNIENVKEDVLKLINSF
jgi:glycine hydroxymethyltransferase